ncbi:MAG: hypothetical protein AB7S75_20530 [Desulfococcaceae bacterium]
MNNSRNIIIFLLISALLLSSFPVFPPEDMDRDSRIGLKDAILSVMGFVRDAAEPGKLSEKAGNTFSALAISAGLKTVIASDDSPSFPPPPVFLVSFFIFFLSLCFFSYISERECLFVSHTIYRDVPPS